MISLRRRALSVLCAVTLAASMVPTQAFAETPAGGALNDAPDIAPVTVEADAETSARELQGLIQPLSLSSVGPVPLKASSEVRWIDRLNLLGYETVVKFYEALEMASDGDGDRDYLIQESYSLGSASSTGTGVEVGDYNNEKKCIIAYVGSYTKEEPFNDERFAQALPYVYAAYAAFDRDHPEVFWLSGSCKVVGWGVGGKLYVGYSIDDTSFSGLYPSETSILQGIKARDANLDTIISSIPQNAASSIKVKGLNYWLTHHNAYNNSNLKALETTYPDAWECVSALAGQVGAKGPVCEAYARAFKVLCDEEGIPCVLVDGYAKESAADVGEAHMWNYVQVEDGKWYAVDVTWNDPGKAATPISQNENENWLLVGASTVVDGMEFQVSHPVTNKVHKDDVLDDGTEVFHPSFTNGPVLYREEYEAYDCQKKGHINSPELKENEKTATCVRAGSFDRVIYCAMCGEELSRAEKAIPALGHSYGAYVYNNDAKVGVDGTETATCSRCGAKNTRTKAGSALKADTSNPGTTQPTTPTTKPSTPATPTAPSTPTTKPSTSTGSSATTAAPVLAVGQTVVVGAASYKATGAATVTYAGPSNKKAASVTVPATVAISGRTYKVTAIAPKAFAGNKYLKSVKIGANVAAIPASAFKGCTKLTSVSFGSGITSLGKNAFYGCKALKSVTLGTKVATIGDGAFQNCTKLTKVTVKSKSLKSVGKSAFASCKALKSVTLSSTALSSIGASAFSGCAKLSAVTLKTTKLKSVGKNALKGTAKKLTVKVPKAKVKAYQKLFKSKGSKTVAVKK